MKVQVITPQELYSFLSTQIRVHPVRVYAHVLTEPFLSLLCEAPVTTKRLSAVFLDGEKRLNDYATETLSRCGYRVYYVNKLHAKVFIIGVPPRHVIIGSSNPTSRSLRNFEVILLFSEPSQRFMRELQRVLRRLEDVKYVPKTG